ncbi:MAG: homoserine dehydrogenase [Candidatus Dormibacteria bacterium]
MSPDGARDIRLALIGHGWVGRALEQLLEQTAPELSERHGVSFRRTLMATRRAGILVAGGGISPAAWQRHLEAAQPSPTVDDAVPERLVRLLADPAAPYDVLVELTTASPNDGQPAAGYLAAALASGRDAVTANKAPVAWHAAALQRAAEAAGSRLRYEAAVMDCLPVLAIRSAMVPVGAITGFAGVVNSTTNHVLTAMAAGDDGPGALLDAQRRGIAEADPAHDLSGHDAALKATILANLLFDLAAPVTPAAVGRQGIEPANPSWDPSWPGRAAAAGRRVKLVARGVCSPEGPPELSVQPEELPLSDGLARIDGTSMGLRIDSALGGRLDMVSTTPGVEQTAYAVLMDLLALAGDHRGGRG